MRVDRVSADSNLQGWALVNWEASYGWLIEFHFIDRRPTGSTTESGRKDRTRAKFMFPRPSRMLFSRFVAGSVVDNVTVASLKDGTTLHRFSFSDGSFAEVEAEGWAFARW